MANRNRRILYPLAFILLLIPAAAYANMGSPIMIAGILHLIIGNLFIGIIEGLLLTLVFKAKWIKAISIMITANYFSTFIGWLGLSLGFIEHSRITLYNAPRIMWIAIVVFIIGTIVLESPFCIRVLSNKNLNRRMLLKKAVLASVLAQALSYGLLIPYYTNIGEASLYTKLKLDRSLSLASGVKATVYYIGLDGDVYTIGIDGKNRRKFIDSNIDENSKLIVKKSPDADAWDLLYRTSRDTEKVIVKQFTKEGIVANEDISDFGDSSSFLSKKKQKWDVKTGFWAEEGLRAKNEKTGESIHITYATPFLLSWQARNATILTESLIVYQLGNQIVLLDLDKRKIGLITMGRGPIVKMD